MKNYRIKVTQLFGNCATIEVAEFRMKLGLLIVHNCITIMAVANASHFVPLKFKGIN